MRDGIRAELAVDPAGTCPVVRAAGAADAPTGSISRDVAPTAEGSVTEEFTVEDGAFDGAIDDTDLQAVFRYETKTVYRFERPRAQGSPCACVESHGCPITDLHTRDGLLYLVFHAADMEELRAIITTLRGEFPTVDIRRLLRSRGGLVGHDLVVVDRDQLTPRQREVLERAHQLGYFDHPKGANAGEVAEALDISRATFREHLGAAQTKLLDAILEA